MQVCLITPPSPFLLDDRVFPALGILRVGAALESAGHKVDHIDLCGVINAEEAVINYQGATVFGITATTPQIPAAIRIGNILRQRPNAKTIIGGPHPTLVHAAAKRGNERAIKALDYLLHSFDVVVAGDGEKAIFTALHSRGLVDADDPKGILWNTSKDFEQSPWPSRHLVDMDSYHYRIGEAKATSMIAQLGCLSPDTPIVLSDGYEKAISDIKVGDEVLCFDTETKKTVSRKVENSYEREADDLWEIEWNNGQKLLITGEHPIFTREGWKTVQEIEVGGVCAYLCGMRYEFSSAVQCPTGQVLQPSMPVEVDEEAPRPQVDEIWTGNHEGTICGHVSRADSPILHRGEEQPTNAYLGDSGEVVIHKTRGPEPYETARSSGEGIEYDQSQIWDTILGPNEKDMEGWEVRPAHQWNKEYFSKQDGGAICGDSVQRSSPVSLRRKWSILDRTVFIGKAPQPGLYFGDGSQGDLVSRGALAPRREGTTGVGLFEQGMDSAYGMVEGIEDGKSPHTYGETPILWSTVRSKRFIGKGTVCNITICPTHNYFANGMLVHNCPFHCKFCGGRNSPMLRQIRVRPSNSVIDEMMHLHNTYGITGVMHFQDELNVSHKGLVDLMVKIKETGIPWQQRGFVKAELFNEEQAEAMYAAGFRWLLCGFEAAHPRILKNIAKNATREQNSQMLRTAHKHGIKVKALMSAGHPGESEETILATRDWLLEEKPDDFDVTIITVYPGTPYFDESVCIGEPVYKFVTNGDILYSENTDFHRDMQYYKGAPGAYKSYVWTPDLSRERLCELRDEVEDEVRRKLGIPYATGAAAINFEHSMGQHLPSTILRSSIK